MRTHASFKAEAEECEVEEVIEVGHLDGVGPSFKFSRPEMHVVRFARWLAKSGLMLEYPAKLFNKEVEEYNSRPDDNLLVSKNLVNYMNVEEIDAVRGAVEELAAIWDVRERIPSASAAGKIMEKIICSKKMLDSIPYIFHYVCPDYFDEVYAGQQDMESVPEVALETIDLINKMASFDPYERVYNPLVELRFGAMCDKVIGPRQLDYYNEQERFEHLELVDKVSHLWGVAIALPKERLLSRMLLEKDYGVRSMSMLCNHWLLEYRLGDLRTWERLYRKQLPIDKMETFAVLHKPNSL